MISMADSEKTRLTVKWYRSRVTREQLSQLNKRSDLLGLAQTLGFLGLLATTGVAAWYSAYHWPWWVTLPVLYFHGTCWNFQINGFHELVHDSVFATRWLNKVFLFVLSFLGWLNPYQFWASHTEHHKYTLHPPDDLEVILPVKLTLRGFFSVAIVSPMGLYWTLRGTIRNADGRVQGQWMEHLFPQSDPARRRPLVRWARILLAGHLAILVVAIVMRWWMLPVIVTLAPFYGGALHYLCNNSQHSGLCNNVSDFRLCCRTVLLNPFLRFLYWHMNYHTEHHMYAAVPCYRLGRLHRLIRADLPECPRGLLATWRQIIAIMKRQKQDPTYRFQADLPAPPDATPVASVASIS
ncbi:MAG: hypothetical protein BIFFINMI_03220 [Phycisphaerae bacterium]|nr:hypothetical protein [Phycisphaerae bacterium]